MLSRTTAALALAIGIAVAGCAASHPGATPVATAPTTTTPAATPPTASGATPCFPGGPALEALAVYQKFEQYAISVYEPDSAPPKIAYGTCTVENSQIREADGRVVAELGCGLRVMTAGIVDDLGLQLGARGQDVLDRKPHPVPSLRCMANGPDQVRCMFDRREDEDTDATWYMVAGQLGEDALTGAAATAYFGPRPLVEIYVSSWCH